MCDREKSEAEVRALVQAGRTSDAVDGTLALYGDGWFGYLVSLSRDPAVAADVFQELCIDIWRGLAAFEWRSSLRTWGFTLARNAWSRHTRGVQREVRLGTREAGDLRDRWTRTATAAWRRTEARSALHDALDALDPPDRELLALRLTERLDWKEIVAILEPEGDPSKGAATLRKRYQRLKDRLREQLRGS